ncbi:hypothetical protein EUTSA_v10019457mg [Eutrema salsugineum]|uniref:MATH domain-containing protein n=1 Tax=Eutrema salsugineum TaxID=72664 RepID=V4KLW3_EUTSA|nr:hypothetical protein EUTSA_v10019457mg [Eutrema salsugineum]
MGSSSAVSTIVQSWREHPPSSYSLKIHNFSQLENSTSSSDHKYQSRLFSSGGYNWRLIVYPKGNEKDNGSGFISMYVEIDSKNLMIFTPPIDVFAELRFFEVKRFNALKTVRGLAQVLPYDTFSNPEDGYIFERDQCEFGVDVIVSPPLTNWEVLSFNEKLPHPNQFSWAVKNFSELKEDKHTSNSFSMGRKKWVLYLYPKGDSRVNGKWLSVFLSLADSDKPKADEKIFTQAHVRVVDPHGSNHFARKFFILTELLKLYLDKEDILNVEIEFEVVSATKHSHVI